MAAMMNAIAVENPGENYRLTITDIPKPAPKAGEILIAVAAAGLNRADIVQSMGRYPPPPGAPQTLGMEVSGTVAELGEGVTAFKKGDAVCALLGGGGYAQFCTAAQECVLPVPKGVSLADAAALPEVHFTVWTNLIDTARLKPGDSVLIHGGSSGIGTAAIQLCTARGHKVFATAGSADKCKACEELGAARAINYREEDFVDVIKKETDGKGVDVILDMVGGDYIQRNMSAAALWGRIVNIAYMQSMQAQVNFAPMLMKRLSLLATTLRARSNAEKGAIRDALLKEVWPLIEAGKIRPVVDSTYPLAEAQKAHDRMAKSSHIGKILLTM
ncbi:MAG TPA: NAD(P)H-quinone oxidoreductase [Rhizomicrobium sp.]|jgi:putative PIG3 family NAD(P)H quinone oxidoreductase|nr:NAD(P)H-quinone oxidoreductase [Rhizomicrobium sp.]